MALHNQPGIYNEAVNLNPLPYVNIALQARARKQAREDAIDKYYQKLPDTINDKGLRDQEIPIINEYKNKIFEFGLKNKEALRNPKVDNGAAQFQLQKLMRDAQGVARNSQNAAKTDLELGKLWFNKENQWALNNDDFVKAHDAHNLPVTDPNYKPMDLANIMAQKPFDKSVLIKRNSDIKYSDGTPEITPHPTDPLSQIVTTRPSLDEENKKVLYARAADDLHNDPKFAKHIKSELVGTGQLQPLVKIANDVFKIPSDQLTDEGLAAAYEYSLLPVKQTTQKVVPNTEAVMDKKNKFAKEQQARGFAHAERMAGLRFGYSKALKDYTAGVDAEQDDKVLNTFIKNTYDNSKEERTAYVGGKDYKGKLVDLPKDIKDKYIYSKGNTDEAVPDAWLLTDDKQTLIPMFYGESTTTGGRKLKVNPNSKPIDIQNFKVDLGKLLLTQKQRGGEVIDQFDVEGTTPTAPPKVKATTKSGLPVFHK